MDKHSIANLFMKAVNALLSITIIFLLFKIITIPYHYSARGSDFSLAQALNSIRDKNFSPVFDNNYTNDAIQTILILGVPGQGNSAPNLSDTIMLAITNPTQKKLVLFSIPRDLWVRAPNLNYETKINALYQIDKSGLSYVKKKVSRISGLPINDYLVFNLESVQQIIDRIGGIEVNVEKDIYDFHYPSSNFSYKTFVLLKGKHVLDGQTAIKYIRTRHGDNDFARTKRQQQVLKAVAEKIFSKNPIWHFSLYLDSFNVIKNSLKTDLSLLELKKIWDTIYQIGVDNIQSFTLDNINGNNLLIGDQIKINDDAASILLPLAGKENYAEIQKNIKMIIEQKL